MARRRTDLFGSPSVTIWPCHCLPRYPCQGPLAHTTCVTPWAHLCLTRVASFLDHRHLSPDGNDGVHNRALHLCLLSIFLPLHSPLVVAQIPQPTDGGSSPEHAWGLARWGHAPCPEIAQQAFAVAESVQAASVWSRHSWIFDTNFTPQCLRDAARSCEIRGI